MVGRDTGQGEKYGRWGHRPREKIWPVGTTAKGNVGTPAKGKSKQLQTTIKIKFIISIQSASTVSKSRLKPF
jgi:hypothetical protein